jgi:hypothetical protein
MLDVTLGRLFGMVACVQVMTVRDMRVVRRLLMRTGFMVLCRLFVMARGMLEVFGRLLVMFRRLFRHRAVLLC